jgi:hypothetical protein
MIKRAIAVCTALTFSGVASAETIEPIEKRMHQAIEPKSVVKQAPSRDEQKSAIVQKVEQRLNKATDEWTNITGEFVPGVARQKEFKRVSELIVHTNFAHSFDGGTGPDAARRLTDKLTDPQRQGLWLQKLPTIRIVVQPMPPKDFLLTINGEQCPATEKAIYRVPEGAVTVRVWREGSASCEKTYDTVAGQVYDVQCAF